VPIDTPNRLAAAVSPYLLAHARDPVDWHEWGDEAFAAARRRDVPILLSVGYSACHWCHVMARESFSDPATAELINRSFVAVKVDREERPDLDRIYLDAVTTLTGRAGWPLTAFLTPSGEPFFGGTYFPREARHGLPAFTAVLAAVSEAWRGRRSEVAAAGAALARRLASPPPTADADPGPDALGAVYRALERDFDPVHGGFGEAPKFPPAAALEFLLRITDASDTPRAAPMVQATLAAMADGGIHDQIGGGFSRYAVDRRWLVPHFEKMLYDNALLGRLYTRAAQVTGDPGVAGVARTTLDYLVDDLGLPDGGFAASEDADSEGEEGRFYVFTWAEFLAASGDAASLAAPVLGAAPEGNFEGRIVLHRARPAEAVARDAGTDSAEVEEAVVAALEGLRALRANRVRPERDDKAVAAWNGLAIRALAESATVLGEPRYLEAAVRAARFALAELRRPDGRLLRSRRAGRGDVPAFCEDYGAVALGLFALFRADGDPAWFDQAGGLVEDMIDLFGDGTDGGFFATGRDAPSLIARPLNLSDHPTPSDNALAAEALLTLAAYTGEARYGERAAAVFRVAGRLFEGAPTAVAHLAGILAVALAPARELAVVGPAGHPTTAALLAVAEESFRPDLFVAWGDGHCDGGIPLLQGRVALEGRPTAYLCRGHTCTGPTMDAAELRRLLTRRFRLSDGERRVGP